MLTTTVRDGVDLITLERGKVNALDLELVERLSAALAEAEKQTGRGAVILTGTGNIFSAGVDLFRLVDGGREYIERFLPALNEVFLRLFELPRPAIAAINGHAIAGGCILACACDYRVMANGAGRIGLPELTVGVPFPVSAIELLRSVTGSSRLQELLYFGRTYEPADARSHGLIDEVAPADRLLARAVEVARDMMARPAESFRLTKQYVRAPAVERIRAADRGRNGLIDAWASPQTLDAIRAYLQRTLRK